MRPGSRRRSSRCSGWCSGMPPSISPTSPPACGQPSRWRARQPTLVARRPWAGSWPTRPRRSCGRDRGRRSRRRSSPPSPPRWRAQAPRSTSVVVRDALTGTVLPGPGRRDAADPRLHRQAAHRPRPSSRRRHRGNLPHHRGRPGPGQDNITLVAGGDTLLAPRRRRPGRRRRARRAGTSRPQVAAALKGRTHLSRPRARPQLRPGPRRHRPGHRHAPPAGATSAWPCSGWRPSQRDPGPSRTGRPTLHGARCLRHRALRAAGVTGSGGRLRRPARTWPGGCSGRSRRRRFGSSSGLALLGVRQQAHRVAGPGGGGACRHQDRLRRSGRLGQGDGGRAGVDVTAVSLVDTSGSPGRTRCRPG